MRHREIAAKAVVRLVSFCPVRHNPAFGIVARGSSHENVNCPCSGLDLREVAKVRHLREAMREHGAREGIDLREPCRAPAESFPGDAGRFNAGTNGPVDHLRPRFGRGL